MTPIFLSAGADSRVTLKSVASSAAGAAAPAGAAAAMTLLELRLLRPTFLPMLSSTQTFLKLSIC